MYGVNQRGNGKDFITLRVKAIYFPPSKFMSWFDRSGLSLSTYQMLSPYLIITPCDYYNFFYHFLSRTISTPESAHANLLMFIKLIGTQLSRIIAPFLRIPLIFRKSFTFGADDNCICHAAW